MEEEELFLSYADVLLGQMPCFRMNRSIRRNRLYLDPNLKGIIYHTIKFCDYYGFEYASIKRDIKVPLLKIETDFTSQSAGQLLTSIQAFEETIEGSEDMDPGKGISEEARKKMESGIFYVAGIDSGSTSTDAVIPAVNVGSSISGRIDPHDLLFLNSRFLNRQIQTLLGAHHRRAGSREKFPDE